MPSNFCLHPGWLPALFWTNLFPHGLLLLFIYLPRKSVSPFPEQLQWGVGRLGLSLHEHIQKGNSSAKIFFSMAKHAQSVHHQADSLPAVTAGRGSFSLSFLFSFVSFFLLAKGHILCLNLSL